MKMFSGFILFVLVGLLAVAAYFLHRMPVINQLHHQLYVEVSESSERDLDLLVVEMLRVEKGLRPFYDFVEFRLQDIARKLDAMDVVPSLVADQKDRDALLDGLGRLKGSYKNLDTRVQKFKTGFSLLNNSRIYLPLLLKQYRESESRDLRLVQDLSDIVYQIMEATSLNADAQTRRKIVNRLEGLSQSAAYRLDIAVLDVLKKHAEIALLYDEKVRENAASIDSEILPLMRDDLQNLRSNYQALYDRAQGNQTRALQVAYVSTGAVVAIALFFIINQLLYKRLLERAMRDFSAVICAQAEGDFTRQATGEYPGPLAVLKDGLNETSEKLRRILGEVSHVTGSISQTASFIANFSDQYETDIHTMAETIDSSKVHLGAIDQTSQQFSTLAESADQTASDSKKRAGAGAEIMEETVVAMAGILEAATEMNTIINNIDGIAFRTNLLALNAAVEAARAGEHGAGFAVVAGEVRSLSKRTTDASEEIRDLIIESISKIENGSQLMQRTNVELVGIVDSIQDVSGTMATISSSTHEQAENVRFANDAIMGVSSQVQGSLQSFQQAAAMAKESQEHSERLKSLVGQFKLA